jgi:hypothetical protein
VDGELHAGDSDIPVGLLHPAVVVELYLLLSVRGGQDCDVPDLEQLLQVLLAE